MGKPPIAEVTIGERCGIGPRADAGWYPARVVRLHRNILDPEQVAKPVVDAARGTSPWRSERRPWKRW
jgi:hypothetical protein